MKSDGSFSVSPIIPYIATRRTMTPEQLKFTTCPRPAPLEEEGSVRGVLIGQLKEKWLKRMS